MINNDDFWNNIENDEYKILKYNENGEYDSTVSKHQIQLMEAYNGVSNIPTITIGSVINGTISKLTEKELIIDVNYKDSVYVEVKNSDAKIISHLKVGEDIDVMITRIKDNPYEIIGSITELIKIDVANKLRDKYKNKEALEATVLELIPAGFMLSIEMNNITLTAFMPNTLAGVNRLSSEQSQALVGQKMNVMLETLQQEKGVYVVSRKKYLLSLIPDEIEKLEKGKVYTGMVTGSKDFGVFVEFNGCLTGMIHKVNLNIDWQDRINEITPGYEIDFYVQDILKGNRLILTQNLEEKSLWNTIKVNQIKTGEIIAIKPFGALVSLDSQTMGLIQTTYINKAGRVLKKGDKIEVKVISVIKDERKIYLSFPD
jgi:ribosomal protein S1